MNDKIYTYVSTKKCPIFLNWWWIALIAATIFTVTLLGGFVVVGQYVLAEKVPIMNREDAYKLLFDRYGQHFEVHTYTSRCVPPSIISNYNKAGVPKKI